MRIELSSIFCISSLVLGANCFYNPVIKGKDLPDPGAILWNNQYYVASTSGTQEGKFPIHRSGDLQNWDFMGYALPRENTPAWAQSPDGDFWAPELHLFNDVFHLYFTLRDKDGVLCIGVATSDTILGPYKDSGSPLIKQNGMGSIDATLLTDLQGGNRYIIWKDDGNAFNPNKTTTIWAQKLNPNGLSVQGEKHEILRNTLSWEGAITEGPWIINRGGWYYLFYSGEGYFSDRYAVGVARSKSALGPYEKKGEPMLTTAIKQGAFAGPGHCSVIKTADQQDWVMIYHAWKRDAVCNGIREQSVDYLDWTSDEWPKIRSASYQIYQNENLFLSKQQ